MNQWVRCLILGVGLSMSGLAAAPLSAAPSKSSDATPEKKVSPHVVGMIVTVSAKNKTITVKEGEKEQILQLARSAKLTRNGKRVSLDTIKAGEKVDATMIKVNGKDYVGQAVFSA